VPGRDKEYNIVTPVVPLFPAEQASWFSPEKEKDRFRRTIEWMQDRYNRNNSVVMLNVARARLSMTEAAYADTRNWFKGKEQANGLFYWQAHGFYMTEQTAVAGLINEFLLQSVDNIIRVFPAWPKDKDASFTRLRARGGFLVTAEQKAGKITQLEITSTVGGKLRLLDPWMGRIVEHATKPGQTIRRKP
jgi:alpha-L-fucosidase 2